MATENENQDTQADDGASEGAEAQDQGSASSETPSGGGQETAAGDQGDGQGDRQNRRQRQAERKRVYVERDQFARENAELKSRLAELSKGIGTLNRNFEMSRQPPEDPNIAKLKAYRDKINGAIKRLGDDPSALDEWHSLMEERERLNGRIAAAEEFEAREKSRPRPPSAMQMRLVAEFPWLSTDPEANDATEALIHVLAKRRRLDMNDPTVKYKTCREAAAVIARQFDLEVVTPGANGDDSKAQQRLMGSSGKTTASGAGSGVRPNLDPEYVESLAIARYPTMPPPLAVARWWKEIGNKVQA